MTIDPKFDDYQPCSFSNKEIQWAHTVTPDEYKGKKKWCFEMLYDKNNKDDAKEIKILKDAGFNIREKGDKVILKVQKDADKYPNPPHTVGPDGVTPFSETLGNGTVVNVNATAKKWDVCSTITLYIEGIQVVKHVPYVGGGAAATFKDVSTDTGF